ncbi:MAG: T9SS type A sorting domain-containing protein [Sphingobacteriales bacterium]|nr:MAG: T9SS type A sorting domain-containing protein [Sphingobacteriales bacterium]
MKKLILPLFLFASVSTMAQNAMLKNAAKGAVSLTDAENICFASDGTNVVLMAGDKTGLYAIDITDNKIANEKDNTLTAPIASFVTSKLNAAAGQAVSVVDMEVNPVSKAIYVLAKAGANKYLIRVESKGAKVSLVDLSSVNYSKLAWTGTFELNDMAYGNKTLYVTSGSFSLDGEIGWIAPPFTHNATVTKRSTTMFKSNWGNKYETAAPLEVIAFGNVGGKNRLMGVTTCAPGFSVDASTLSGSGLLSVTEDFNVNSGMSSKAVFMSHDKKEWLFDLHDNNLYRIGKKYLDGSQVTANKHNQNAAMLRDNMGKVVATLPADDMKLMSTTAVTSIAQYDNYRLMVLEAGATGALKMVQMSSENPPPFTSIGDVATAKLDMYPNPASQTVTINIPENSNSATLNIVAINGKVVMQRELNTRNTTLDISTLAKGMYVVNMILADGSMSSGKLTIK